MERTSQTARLPKCCAVRKRINKHEQYETHKSVTKLRTQLKEAGTRPHNAGDELKAKKSNWLALKMSHTGPLSAKIPGHFMMQDDVSRVFFASLISSTLTCLF